MSPQRLTMHGVFLEVLGAGVLLTGDAGIGKSELGLELLSRGHRLIADDAPEFSLVGPQTLVGECPPELADFMEVRELGIINVRALFGDNAVKPRERLWLIVHLHAREQHRAGAADRLHGNRSMRDVLGVDIPRVALPVVPGRNLAVLVECTVRNEFLRRDGYDSASDFENRHRGFIAQDRV